MSHVNPNIIKYLKIKESQEIPISLWRDLINNDHEFKWRGATIPYVRDKKSKDRCVARALQHYLKQYADTRGVSIDDAQIHMIVYEYILCEII